MSPYDNYLRIAAEWEVEFARNQRRYGETIHCRKGCSDCCSQMFQITELEAAYISRAVKELPPEARLRMEQRAREYLPKREALLESRDVPDAWGSLPPPGLRLPCPALQSEKTRPDFRLRAQLPAGRGDRSQEAGPDSDGYPGSLGGREPGVQP